MSTQEHDKQSTSAGLVEITAWIEKVYPNITIIPRNKRPPQGRRYTALFLSSSNEIKKFRVNTTVSSGEIIAEEGWIAVGADWAAVSTLWDNENRERIKHYQPVIDFIKPSESGWHRCPTDGKYQSLSSEIPDGTYKSRWAKDLTKENYREVLSGYFKAMELA